MKNIVYLPSRNAEESVIFYVVELGLFEVSEDLGMGSILLRFKHSSDFFLMVSPDIAPRADEAPLFSIEVKDCSREFEKLKRVPFSNGATFLDPNGVIEYPLGKFLKMMDPARNVFILYEWYI